VKRWVRRLAVLGAVVVVVVVLRLTLFRPEPVPVTVYRVERGRVEDTVVNSRAGTVESRQRSGMSPGISGLVTAIEVKKGARVERGQVLLRLDDSEHRAQVVLAQASLDAAEAARREACLSADQAARELARAKGLAERDLLSQQKLEEAQTAAEVGEASCQAARQRVGQGRAALDAARATLAKTVMIAPFDGVVLDVTTEVGEWISPSPPGVMIPAVIDLIDPDDLYVSAPIDEADLARIRVGLPVRITMDAYRNREFTGEISYVSSFVQTEREQNRTLTVEVLFTQDDLPENVLPGISADIEVILDSRSDVLRIPTYSLLEGSRLLVVRGGELVDVPVETGLRNWSFTEIRSGVEAGDPVVVSLDRAEVRAGAKVEVAEETGR